MNMIAEEYISKLKNAYYINNGVEIWDHFEKIKHGISKEDEEKLRAAFPLIPESLIQLLQFVDGTYWRIYNNEKISFFFLGSDLKEYPYYLFSAEEILKQNPLKWMHMQDYVKRIYKYVGVDEKISNTTHQMKWLYFSDCMNNGGTSQLYIDFSPSEKGKVGQIIRYLHDPDEIQVIADSFDDYLKMLIDKNFDFIQEDYLE